MPAPVLLAPFLGWFIGANLSAIVFRAFYALGVGVITYAGVDQFIDHYSAYLFTSLSSLPTQVKEVFGILNIDIFCTILISAYAGKAALTVSKKVIGVR